MSLDEIIGVMDIDFSIDLVRVTTLMFKITYRMSSPLLFELKMKLQEFLKKGYI